jgi:hypothetical protein
VSGQLHAPGRFIPRKQLAGANYVLGLVGPRTILDVAEYTEVSCSYRNRTPMTAARHYVPYNDECPLTVLRV